MSEKQVKIPSASERTNIFSPQTVTNRSGSSSNASAETNVFSLGTAINNNTNLYGSGSNTPSGTNVFSLGAATNANAVLLPCSASLISLHDLNTGTDTLYCALPLDSYIFLEKIAQLRQHFNNLNKEQKDELLLQLQNRRLFQQQLTNYLQQQTLLLQKYNQRQGQRPRNNYICQLCNKAVHSSKLPCHVRMVHLKIPLYSCTKCSKSSAYSKNNIKVHMFRKHGITDPEPTDRSILYVAKVKNLMKQCFPNVKSRDVFNSSFLSLSLTQANDSD